MNRIGWTVLTGILLMAGVLLGKFLFGNDTSIQPVLVKQAVPAAIADSSVLRVPVAGVARRQLTDTWGQARSEGREHHGTDIVAPGGSPVLAAAAGTVEKLWQSRLGGTALYERSSDRRWTFYYAHLQGYAPGIVEGKEVQAGELLGYVGDTGDAGPGNYHLHFSLTRTTREQHWYEGEDVNPYPSLAGKPLPR